MTPETIMSMGRQAIEITVMVSAPLLLAALVIGLVVSIFQAATQINETTLSFIPKFMGIMVTLVIAGPWILTVLGDYFRMVLTSIPNFTR
ncbi:MAG: flagellar biosynthesis protein FliQ, partial [Comamonadaceae bacterium]